MKNRGFKNDLNLNLSSQSSLNVSNSPYYSSSDNVSTQSSQTTNTVANGYNLTPMSTNTTNTSMESLQNYHLTKMETNDSIDSNYSLQQQFRIELNLNKREIDLIRFTWNRMLLDEPIVESKSSLPIPGGFNFGNEPTSPGYHKPVNNIASSLFCRQLYSNLLGMDPQLERLFPSIKHQAVAFAGVMSLAISQLESLSNLNDYLEKLGKRHSRILGIEPSMFEMMGEALIKTFHERFGAKFHHDLEILWIKLYLYLANSLLQFGIDPVLKLHKPESHSNFSPHIFRTNEINQPLFSLSSSNSNSNLNAALNQHQPAPARDNDMMSMVDDKRDRKKEKSSMKKKKKDCVIM